MSLFDNILEWIDVRINERKTASRAREFASFDPSIPTINAGLFDQKIADLAETLRNKVEREGPSILLDANPITDVTVILSQLAWTYNLLRWINADDTRHGVIG
jgi:hypothetical protein